MTPDGLRDALQARGLVVLDVAPHHVLPDVLVVYLHGPAGQWADGTALNVIRSVPQVAKTWKSDLSEVIWMVRLLPTPPSVPMARAMRLRDAERRSGMP